MQCDMLIKNGTVYTMDDGIPQANWVAVADGKITALGMHEPEGIQAGCTLDLEGKVLLPGLIDSHMHGTPTGEYLNSVNLLDADCVQDVIKKIAGACEMPGDDWIVASGLNIAGLREGRPPYRWELDAVSGEHPVIMKNVTLHGNVFNTKGFELVNVPDHLNGIVTLEDGTPTGEFTSDDSAFLAAANAAAMQPDSVIKKYIKDTINDCAAKGVTTISALDGGLYDAEDRDVFLWLNGKDSFPIHVNTFFQRENANFAKALGLPRIGGCLCLDGAGFEGTMAMREPYNDGEFPTGILYWTDERLYRFLSEANKMGLQTAVHALGDRAIDQYLRVYERVYHELGLEGNPYHNRIEHFAMTHPEQIKKVADMGLILSMQPMFTCLWDNPADEKFGHDYEKMVGRERCDGSDAFPAIIKAGGIIAGGSDSPVTEVNPLGGIYAACCSPQEFRRVSVHEALKMFTIHGAIANWQEDVKGSITVGKLADFVVLDRDPYQEPEAIRDFTVEKTIVAGKIVYTKEHGVVRWNF